MIKSRIIHIDRPYIEVLYFETLLVFFTIVIDFCFFKIFGDIFSDTFSQIYYFNKNTRVLPFPANCPKFIPIIILLSNDYFINENIKIKDLKKRFFSLFTLAW